MSATTIRDVLIKVSVENGNLKLGPLDTSSIEAALDKIKQKTVDALSGGGQFSTGGGGGSLGGGSFSAGGFQELVTGARALYSVLGPVTAGFAVLAGELLATKVALDQATSTNKRYYESMTNDALKTMQYQTTKSVLDSNQSMRMASGMHDVSSFNRYEQNYQRSMSREAEIRAYESRSDVTPEMKSSFRSRTETRGGLEEKRTGIEDRLSHARAQLAEIEKAQEANGLARVNSQSAAANVAKSAEEQAKNALRESTPGFLGRQAYRAAVSPLSALGINMGVDKSGYLNSQMTASDEAKDRGAKAIKDSNAEQERLVEKDKELAEKKLGYNTEIAQSTKDLLYTTKEIQQAAYAALQSAKEDVRGKQISFGSSGVVNQNRVLRLQKKHDEIQKKKEENRAAGIDENTNLPRYTNFELQHGMGSGSVADITMEEQSKRDAIAKGYRPRGEEELDKRQKEYDAEMKKDEKPQQLKEMVGAVINVNKAATDIVEAMKEAFPFERFVETVKERLRVEAETRKDEALLRSFWF